MRGLRSILCCGLLLLLGLSASPLRPAHADGKSTLQFPTTPEGELEKGGKAVRVPALYDYGNVAQYAQLTATIPYRNTGTRPLEGLRVKSGCSCFGATLSVQDLAPGATGTLTVLFRSATFKGLVAKPLSLLYRTAAGTEVAKLWIRARVIDGILVERAWFGEVRAGSKPTTTAPVAWFVGVGTPFTITKIEVPGPKVATRIEPYKVTESYKEQESYEEDGEQKTRWVTKTRTTYKGFTVHYTFLEAPPKGIYSKRATLHTTHPKHPTVTVPLSATVVGAVWVQTSRVYLGLIPAGKARSASVAIKASGKEPPPLLNVRVTARKGVLQVSVKDGFDPFKGPHKVITVTVPENTPPGLLDDVLEVRTGPAGGEVTEIQVRGRIYQPQGGSPRRGR